MALDTRISNGVYERLALAQPDRKWELQDGRLREKPAMTFAHNSLEVRLGHLLMSQLDWDVYEARIDAGRVRRPGGTYFIPDLFLLPLAYVTPHLRRDDVLEVYDQPLPLVVEIWSRSTAEYDINEKLRLYQDRGDLEIWRIHPYERTLTAWRRQADGSYEESLVRDGMIEPQALPGVTIDLAALFDG
jgi:Uma2 family endonuclease